MNKPFKTFIADFLYMGRVFKLSEDHLIQLLREKLLTRLMKPMLAQNAIAPFTLLRDLKDYLSRDREHGLLHLLLIPQQR